MSPARRQLPLPLPALSIQGAEDFLVTDSNAEAARWLDAWPDWPGGGLLLHGPAASGKSHLAAIWAERAEASVLPATELTPALALNLEEAIAVDDIDADGSEGGDSEGSGDRANTLFHLINTARSRNLSFLLTARKPATAWTSGLADLDSRLRALPAVGLHPPDDELLAGLTAKLFADRQITVPDDVIAFMLANLERSCAAVAAAVERMDRASLAERRKVTRQLAQDVLRSSG